MTLDDAQLLEKNPKVSINQGSVTAVREYGKRRHYQLDVRANGGNSGGPIVNHRGEAIAVLNAGIQTMQSINYAIPSKVIAGILPASMTTGWPVEESTKPGDEQDYESFKSSIDFKLSVQP
jgi:S1-C subfamily serine protease